MNPLWLTLIVPGMHLFSSCVLAGFFLGPSMAFGGIVLSVFGWYFLPFELIAASAIFEFYNPPQQQNKIHTIKIGLLIGIIGAVLFSPFVPKEEGKEVICWVGSVFAGFSSALFAFVFIHLIKQKKKNTRSVAKKHIKLGSSN